MIFFGPSGLNNNINLIISCMELGVIIWAHEKCSPYNHNINNIMEALSIFNLLMVFVASLYTTLNTLPVNISVSLTIFQLACIILLHVKELLCSTLFKNTKPFWGHDNKILEVQNRHRSNSNYETHQYSTRS